jgi:endonuclease/exonuclease/phosphatase family metal-dependent hydrolase
MKVGIQMFVIKGIFTFCFTSILAFNLFAAKPITRIATYNIRNYKKSTNKNSTTTHKSELLNIIKSTKAHLIAVQEIVDDYDFKDFISKYLPSYRVALSKCGGLANQKLGFIYNSKVYQLQDFYEDHSITNRPSDCKSGLRPDAVGIFKRRDSRLKIAAISVHLKAGGGQNNADIRYKQLKKLSKIINGLKNDNFKHFAIMGDFNTTDYLLGNHNHDRFVEFTLKNNLIDFSEELGCTAYWWGGIDDGLNYGSVLDHILISESLYDNFNSTESKVMAHCNNARCKVNDDDALGRSFTQVSDHCPVVATLK